VKGPLLIITLENQKMDWELRKTEKQSLFDQR
jgi:hypothetical protein